MSKRSVSSFKNAYPDIRKDLLINGVVVQQSQCSYGPFITCSKNWICYNRTENSVGVMPLNVKGRFDLPFSISHAGYVAGIQFSPFDPDLLASCSHEGDIKIQRISRGASSTPTSSTLSTSFIEDKVETISFHPSVLELLTCAGSNGVIIYDYDSSGPKEGIQIKLSTIISMDWHAGGRHLLLSNKSGEILILDPRNQTNFPMKYQSSLTESKICYVGDAGYFLQCGYDKSSRKSQVILYDSRNLSSSLSQYSISDYKQVPQIVANQEKNIFAITTKGSQKLFYGEVLPSNRGNQLEMYHSCLMDDNIVGVTEIPRECLDIMNYEVMRCAVLTTSAVRWISFTVTRPNKMDFAEHLFPPIFSGHSEITASDWLKHGKDYIRQKVSLDPNISRIDGACTQSTDASLQEPMVLLSEEKIYNPSGKTKVTDQNYSKFKYIQIKEHPEQFISGLNNLEKKTPINCDGAIVHKRLLAVPLAGSSGRIGIIDTEKSGKIPDNEPYFVEAGGALRDFSVDSGERIISLLSEDGSLNVWNLQNNGSMPKSGSKSEIRLQSTQTSPSIVKLNNFVENLMVTACNSGSIHIWDLEGTREVLKFKNQDESKIMSLSWNNVGSKISTLSGRKYIELWDPRNSNPVISRINAFFQCSQGRVNWIEEYQVIATGLDEGSKNILLLFDIRNPTKELSRLGYGVEVNVLIPHYDEDTKLIHMYSKGTSRIRTVEVRPDSNGLLQCLDCTTQQQYMASAFFRKDVVDVKKVEIMRCAHIYSDSISISSIKVSRNRGEFFQDDIYPPTRVTWKSHMNACQWLSSSQSIQYEDFPRVSLRPSDMQNVTDQPTIVKSGKYDSESELSKALEKDRSGLLKSDMMDKIKEMADEFAEDEEFGDSTRVVDETEWDG